MRRENLKIREDRITGSSPPLAIAAHGYTCHLDVVHWVSPYIGCPRCRSECPPPWGPSAPVAFPDRLGAEPAIRKFFFLSSVEAVQRRTRRSYRRVDCKDLRIYLYTTGNAPSR